MLSPKPLSARENEISFVTSSTTTCGPEVGDLGDSSLVPVCGFGGTAGRKSVVEFGRELIIWLESPLLASCGPEVGDLGDSSLV